MNSRSRTRLWSAGILLFGIASLVVLLLVTGASPKPVPQGLPDPGPLVGWAIPVAGFLSTVFGSVTVGMLLVAVFLLPSTARLEGLAVQAVRLASVSAWCWLASIVVVYWATVADLYARSPGEVNFAQWVDFARNFATGRGLAVQALTVLIVALWTRWTLSVGPLTINLGLSLLGTAAVGFTGHSASSGSHAMATTSLVIHLVGALLWVGGLIALCWVALRGSKRLDAAVTRYSALALWCFVLVAASGTINAIISLGSIRGLDTTYGTLLIVKVLALAALGVFGVAQRRRLHSRGARFATLALFEITLMVFTFAVAVVLSRTPPPVGENVLTTPSEILLGRPLPPAPTLGRVLVGFNPDGIGLAIVLIGAALYLTGLRVMRRRGDKWPIGRTISWFVGLAIVGWATFGGLGVYSSVMFSLHMISHMMLSMISPIFLVLGAPMTLALRTLPGPRQPGEYSPRKLLHTLLHSPVSRFYTNPIVAASIFMGTLYAVYFTGLFELMMQTHSGHAIMEIHFLFSGILFYYVIVGVDPSPVKLGPLARFGVLMFSIPFHAFFSVALMSSTVIIAEKYYTTLDRPYATDLLHDQYVGGGIAWAMGEVPLLLVVAAIFIQWFRSDTREAARNDRAADRDDDAELEKYNAYLRAMQDRSK